MFRIRLRLHLACAVAAVAMTLAAASGVHAAPILVVNPDPPVGPGVGGATHQYLAVSWTQTSTWTDVAIGVRGWSTDSASQTGTAWLTQYIGPGTAPGSELAQTSFSFPLWNPQWVPLFSGLTLGPGTWYLILSAPDSSLLGWMNGDGTATTGNGVTAGPVLLTGYDFANTGYAPASNWIGTYPDVAVAIGGTEVPNAVPEPTSMILLGSGLIGVVRVARRSRARAA